MKGKCGNKSENRSLKCRGFLKKKKRKKILSQMKISDTKN